MRIRISQAEIEIQGTKADFCRLALAIEDFLGSGTNQAEVAGERNFDPVPYPALASEVILVKANGKLDARVSEQRLTLSGGTEAFRLLKENLPFDAVPPYHVHLEHSTNEEEVSSECPAIVFSLVAG